jgi:hypothetical protein
VSRYAPRRERWVGARLDPADARAVLSAGRAEDLHSLAKHRDLPTDVFDALLELGHAPDLASNPALSEVQEVTLLDTGLPAASRLARNRHLSFSGQRLLLERFPDYSGILFASGADLDPELVARAVNALPEVCDLSSCRCSHLSLVMEDPVHLRTYLDVLLEHPRLHDAVLADPEVDPDLREHLLALYEGTPFFTSLAWSVCRSGHPDPDLLRRFAEHPDLSIRRASASASAPATREHFERLLARAEPAVLVLLASNPDFPANLHARLVATVSGDPSAVLSALAGNPSLDPAFQRRYLAPGAPGREEFSANLDADPAVLRELHDLLRAEVAPGAADPVLASVLLNPSLVLDPAALLGSWVPDLLASRPLELFALADSRGLDPETLDALLDGFEGTLEDLVGVVSELSSD